MLAAIIATIVTIIVLVVVILVVFALRNRTKTPHANSGKMSVRSISTVGVSSGSGGKNSSSATRVKAPQTSSVNIGEALRMRFVAIGVLMAAVFGSLATKAFVLQVLEGEEYQDEANKNLYTSVKSPAPRGLICDADGVQLVRNRRSLTVLADAEVADDRNVVQRLSAVLGVPYNIVRKRIKDENAGAQALRVISSNVDLRSIAFIDEHKSAFPGVTTQVRWTREYPYGALAAHVLGYVGGLPEGYLDGLPRGSSVESGDTVGISGIEQTYETYLAGEHGVREVVADANGVVRQVVSETDPVKGNDVYLTIKAPVQHAVDKMLADLVAPVDGTIGTGKGLAASAVVMDVTNGDIIAMSNYPTFTPSSFIGGISDDAWAAMNNDDDGYHPLFNRVIAATYPAASTYKAFTGMAGLAYGFADTSRTWTCTGSWDGWDTGSPQMCWLHSGHGTLDFRRGIVDSCDTVFYDIGKQFFDTSVSQNGTTPDTALQDEIAKYNFGKRTGIDLAGEVAGIIPTPEWKKANYADVPTEQAWRGGDTTNMMIGQGYVQVTPLQIAVAYGAIATGDLIKPHLLKEVRNSDGDVVFEHKTEIIGTPDVPAEHLAVVRDGLHGVATDNYDIAQLFGAHGIDAAAKTGTAENGQNTDGTDRADSAWFVCYAPYDDPKYVVACQVEQGGGGSAVAAPLGVEIMATVFAHDAGTLDQTVGAIAGSTGKIVPLSTASSGRTD